MELGVQGLDSITRIDATLPLAGRGVRTDEYLDAMTALWTDPEPEFHGRHVDFSGVDAHPRPAGVRVVVGGRSPGAYRRAVSRGHGFYDNGTPPTGRKATFMRRDRVKVAFLPLPDPHAPFGLSVTSFGAKPAPTTSTPSPFSVSSAFVT
jgi:alkanesulfonate monooxygenase SsuD/methylene tetrahydromethanopterin reductase-like flavin-dependent oxidoreductase (luciferase family)